MFLVSKADDWFLGGDFEQGDVNLENKDFPFKVDLFSPPAEGNFDFLPNPDATFLSRNCFRDTKLIIFYELKFPSPSGLVVATWRDES